MAESRKCEHDQIRGTCEKCYLKNMQVSLDVVRADYDYLQMEFVKKNNECVMMERDYRVIVDRLQDRIDAIHAAHKQTFCQVVKRVLKRYTQAGLKLARRLAQAIRNLFKGFEDGNP